MNFAEVRFWQLLLAGLGLIVLIRWLLARQKPGGLATYDRVALCSLGLYLLACVSWLTLVIFLAVALCSYFGLKWILAHDEKRRAHYLLILIPLQLLPLLYYKYANFVVNQVCGLRYDTLRDLLIPVGISFYTFQKVAFVVDTLAFHHPLPAFLDYLNFACFFPQIVAGPIERRADLLPQVQRFGFRWDWRNLDTGAAWIAAGLFFKCCLADNLAPFVLRQSTTNAWAIWADNIIFGLRIYYDFAGYSLVAVGVARCLGVQLTLNFLSPYCSTSISEFWRRWHITLSQWFRDYVYIPMGGGRTRWWAVNIAVVFVVSGIWHGAGWGFVLWGALHGTYLIVNRLWPERFKLPSLAAWLVTNTAAMGAWLAFYEVRGDMLLAKLKTLLTPSAYAWTHLRAAATQWDATSGPVLGFLLVLVGLTLVVEWQSVARRAEPYYYLRRPWVVLALVLLTLLLSPGVNNAFIYFAF
jgi:alginate O-acetyltransferase complex protein AlgI